MSVLRTAVLCCLLFSSFSSFASISGIPAAGRPCSGRYGVIKNGYCTDGGGWNTDGTNHFVAGDGLNTLGAGVFPWSKFIYGMSVPVSGDYKMKSYWCPWVFKGSCTIADSFMEYSANMAQYIRSSTPIINQDLDFGGGNGGVLHEPSSFCLVLVDSAGRDWGGPGPMMCSDATPLPTKPSTCYINYQNDLNVTMGDLNRKDITTMPGSSASVVKKSVPVLCTRDAGTTVTTSFRFTPLTISGNQVIQSSTTGLGIAIHYNNKVVGPSDSFTETFAGGVTNIDLGFEAVRDPKIPEEDIPTGGFNANAVMVMTEQ